MNRFEPGRNLNYRIRFVLTLLLVISVLVGASWVHDGVESLLFLDYPSEPPRGSPRVVPTEGHFLGASLHMGTGPREMFSYTVLHWHDKSVVPLWGHSHQTASLRGIGLKTTQNNSIQLKTNRFDIIGIINQNVQCAPWVLKKYSPNPTVRASKLKLRSEFSNLHTKTRQLADSG